MPTTFTAPSATTKEKGGRNRKHGRGPGSEAKAKSTYPQTSSFASANVPEHRPGGRSKVKHPGF